MNAKRKEHIENCKKKFEEWASQNRFLVRYVRDGKRNKVGVVVARLAADGIVEYGWSKANVAKKEVFNRYMGLNTAIERLEGIKDQPEKGIPRKVIRAFVEIAPQALRYFHLDTNEQIERVSRLADENGYRLSDELKEEVRNVYDKA